MSRRELRVEFADLAETGDRLVEPFPGLERKAQVEVGRQERRVVFDAVAEAGDRFIQLALLPQLTAQVGVGPGILWVEFDRLAVARDGVVAPAPARQKRQPRGMPRLPISAAFRTSPFANAKATVW